MPFGSVSPVTLALGALCGLLGLVIVYELAFPWESAPADPAPRDLPWQAPAVESDFTLPPLSQFQEVVARPLFLKTRRPGANAGTGAATQASADVELSKYVVSGVVIAPEQRYALIRGINDSSLQRVADGQDFHGWTVKAIEKEAVLFTREREEERLPLLRKTPEKFKVAAQRAALLARRRPAAPAPPAQRAGSVLGRPPAGDDPPEKGPDD